jgi:hypothetical protein
MADNQNTDLPDKSTRQDFLEAKDKIVDIVEVTVEPNRYGITIRFQDKTSLTFLIEPCVFAFPVYEDWTGEEAKILKQYQPIGSEIKSD